MASTLETRFRSLRRARAAGQARAAAAVLGFAADWPSWTALFDPLHIEDPVEEVRMARLLRRAADACDDRSAAAYLALIEARGLHRCGSPEQAASLFDDAHRRLHDAGEPALAAKATVLRVDALAHAGSVRLALALADNAGRRLCGPDAPTWRAILQVNRGNALRLGGQLDEAAKVLDRAASRLEALGDPHSAAIARTNAGVALLDVGDAVRARSRFEASLSVFESANESDMALDVRENIACADTRRGALGEAIGELQALAAEHRARKLPRREAACRFDLAEALSRAGDHKGAEQEALAAADVLQRESCEAERAEALLVAAEAAACFNRKRAGAHLEAAQQAAGQCEREALVLRCRLLRADLDLRDERPVDGRSLRAIERRARVLGHTHLASECALLIAQSASARGRHADATRQFESLVRRRSLRPWLRHAAHAGLARCEAQRGDLAAAIRRIRRVTAYLDVVRSDLPGAWLRTTFVLSELDPYLTRVDLLLERGRRQDCREAAALLDVLAARRFLAQGAPNGLKSDTRQRLERIYDRLARDGDTGRRGSRWARSLELEARRLERRVADAWRLRERADGARENAKPTEPVPLRADEVAIHIWRRGRLIRALVRKGENVQRAVVLGNVEDLQSTMDRVTFHADRLRHFPDRVSPEALDAGLQTLARHVLDPLNPGVWPRQVKLVVDPGVPDLPWEFLPCDGMFLCERHEFLRVPALRVRPRGSKSGVGMCFVAPHDDSLPALRREFDLLPGTVHTVVGDHATRAALAKALRERRVVHVAGHGLYAEHAPALGGVRVSNGWFGAVDVPRKIGARIVILSSCRTGHDEGAEGTAWGGLPTALIAAGARTVLWTARDLDDQAAAEFMGYVHEGDLEHNVADAFAHAARRIANAHGSVAPLLAYRLSGIHV